MKNHYKKKGFLDLTGYYNQNLLCRCDHNINETHCVKNISKSVRVGTIIRFIEWIRGQHSLFWVRRSQIKLINT